MRSGAESAQQLMATPSSRRESCDGSASQGESTLQRSVQHTFPHEDLKRTARDHPSLLHRVPAADILPAQPKRHLT